MAVLIDSDVKSWQSCTQLSIIWLINNDLSGASERHLSPNVAVKQVTTAGQLHDKADIELSQFSAMHAGTSWTERSRQ
jgi:hypothetical protein